MTDHLDVTAANGVPFRVVILPDGQSVNFPRARHGGEPLVEFYDRRYIRGFTTDGQFVSRYFVDTILGQDRYGSGSTGGVDLCGYEPSWKVDADTMVRVRAWLATH